MRHQKRECTHPTAKHHHGTRGAYLKDGCGCFACRIANSNALAAYRAGERWIEYEFMPSVGVRRRLQALSAIGHSARTIAGVAGLSASYIQNLRHDTKHPVVRHETWLRIARAYDVLWSRPNATPAGRRNATRATRNGYVAPLAWDDDTIDDPDAQPHTDEPETAVLDEVLVERYMTGDGPPTPHGSRAPLERREAITRLAGKGWDDGRIGRRVGMNRNAVEKERTRNGIPAGNPKETAA